MKIKKLFLLLTLVLLLMGVSFANEVSDDTTPTIGTTEVVKDAGANKNLDNNLIEELTYNKEIIKDKKENVTTEQDGTLTKKIIEKHENASNQLKTSSEKVWLSVFASNAAVGDNVTISGNLLNWYDNAIEDNVIITINNQEEYVVYAGGGWGVYSFEYTAKIVGINNVTVYYPGTTEYLPATKTTTFKVREQNNPINTQISLNFWGANRIGDLGEEIYIHGKVIGLCDDEDWATVQNPKIRLRINSEEVNLQGTNEGEFSYGFIQSKLGLNTIDVYYLQTGAYKSSHKSISIMVYNRTNGDTKIILKSFEEEYLFSHRKDVGGTLFVYEDGDWNYCNNQQVILSVNGVNYTIETDEWGDFCLYAEDCTFYVIGTNNITAKYVGTDSYKSSNASTTLNLVKDYSYIYRVSIIQIGDKLRIRGELLGTAYEIENGVIIIDVNGDKISTLTNYDGHFYCNYNLSKTGLHNVTIYFEGNNITNASEKYSEIIDVKVCNSSLEIKIYNSSFDNYHDYPISEVELGEKIKIVTSLYCDGYYVDYEPIISINGENYKISYDPPWGWGEYSSPGFYYTNYTTKKIGLNTISWNYAGNNLIRPSNITKTFYVTYNGTIPLGTKITLNKISQVSYSDNVTIKGKLTTDNEDNISNTTIKVSVNGKVVNVVTDKYGIFKYTTKATTIGLNNVTVSYDGDEGYDTSSDSTTFNVVPMQTKITINKITNTQYTDTATITGTFQSTNGKPLPATLTITINGKKYTTKSNTNGTFTLNYKTNTPGTNNVTVSYAGNTKYKATSTKTTFTVTTKATKITINKITNTQYTDTATITGTFQSTNGKPLPATLTITINGKKYTTKSDANGIFTLKYKTNTVGKNNVTVTYAGNTKYKATTTKTTFTVTTKATKIVINKIANTQYTDYATITGTFKSSSGKALPVKLTITINGKKYTTKSDANGIFTLKYKTNTVGKNNVTVTYAGNTKYKATSTRTAFNVTPKATKIIINKISNTQYTDTATITGTFKSTSGKPLPATLTITINGKKYTTKSNTNGTFTLKYKTNTVGTNNITVTYAGNTKYKATTTKTTFNVIAKTA